MAIIRKIGEKTPKTLRQLARFSRQHKKAGFVIIALAFAACLGVLWIVFTPKPQTVVVPPEPKRYSNPTIITEEAELKIQENTPSTGPLHSEKIATYYSAGSSSPKFIYFTNERRDDRIIELTDQIIADLKASGQITDKTTTYSIDYFNDKTVAGTYFQKVNNPKTTTEEKLQLKVSYIATMVYAKNLGFHHIIRISTAKTIKSFQ